MSRYKHLDENLDLTIDEINSELEDLEESASGCRYRMRTSLNAYKTDKLQLHRINNRKARLNRQIKKVEEIKASINPTPPHRRKKS